MDGHLKLEIIREQEVKESTINVNWQLTVVLCKCQHNHNKCFSKPDKLYIILYENFTKLYYFNIYLLFDLLSTWLVQLKIILEGKREILATSQRDSKLWLGKDNNVFSGGSKLIKMPGNII